MMTLGLSISLKLHLLMTLELSFTIVTCLYYRPIVKWVCHINPVFEESIVATGALLRPVSRQTLPGMGISIRTLQCLDGAGTPPKYPLGTALKFDHFLRKKWIWPTPYAEKSYWRGRLSTLDLLVLTSLDQIVYILEILFSFFIKQATLMRRSTVLSLS